MRQTLVIPNSTDTIVLYDPDVYKGIPNLVRMNIYKKIIWEAEYPPGGMNGDAYVAASMIQLARIEIPGKATVHLHANSFSCYYVEIDMNTGKIIDSVFGK